MLSIAIDLLAGRYTATTFNDREAPEWPPHPARFLSALVATWADADDPDAQERRAIAWLEALGAPAITCSAEGEIARRAPVTTFVPVNDATALKSDVSQKSYVAVVEAEALHRTALLAGDDKAVARATMALARSRAKGADDARKAATATGNETATVVAGVLATLPENRGKQGRYSPTVTPDDDRFWFTWPEAEPSDAQRRALDELCARVGRLGHSSTLVSCRVVDAESEVPAPTLVPGIEGEPLRVPRGGMADRLELAFADHQGTKQRLLPAATALYAPPGAVPSVDPPLLGGDWFVLAMPRPLVQGGPAGLKITRGLDLARAVRGALLKHADQPPAEILSGHRPSEGGTDGRTPASGRPHVAIVPLPDVSHRHSDASVQGVAIVLPAETTAGDRRAVERALEAWRASGFEVRLPPVAGPAVRFSFAGAQIERARRPGEEDPWLDTGASAGGARDPRSTLRRGFWCRSSRVWTSATPVALDRFPGDLGNSRADVREAAESKAIATILRSCTYAGLPEPAEVEVDFEGFLSAVPAAGGRGSRSGGQRFPGFVAGGSKQVRLGVHARISFGEPVVGPVLIGAGRYLGHGLCLPVGERSGAMA